MLKKILRFFYRMKVTQQFVKHKIFGITVLKTKNKNPEIKKDEKLYSFDKIVFFEKILSKFSELEFSSYIEKVENITFLYKRGEHDFRGHNLDGLFSNKNCKYLDDENWQAAELFVALPFAIGMEMEDLEKVYCINVPVVIAEETFLRCIVPAASAPLGCPQKFKDAFSYFFDKKGPHFFSGCVTDLENILNSPYELSKKELEESEKLIDLVVSNHLSKYNSQPIKKPELPNNGKRNILVIDQVYGDMSISLTGGDIKCFEYMLQSAIQDNPDANIIIKGHVDGRKSNFQFMTLPENVYFYSDPINMISLLEKIDEVYVYGSAGGLEALLMNKKVHVFGSPIYAGWGLTIDSRFFPLRTRKRTINELFYIIYVRYSEYCNPLTQKKCDIYEAIDTMIKLRDEFFSLYNGDK